MIQRCMAAKGFHYTKMPTGGSDANIVLNDSERPDNLTLDKAKVSGYGIQARMALMAQPEFNQTAGLTPAQKQAWGVAFSGPDNGHSIRIPMPDGGIVAYATQGCLSQSRIQIFGSIQKFANRENVGMAITTDALSHASADPETKVLNTAWASCMSGKGFSNLAAIVGGKAENGRAVEPTLARTAAQFVYRSLPKAAAFQKEIAIATADVGCQDQTGYVAKRRNLEDRYFTAALTLFEPQIAALKEITKDALVRARTLLAGGQ